MSKAYWLLALAPGVLVIGAAGACNKKEPKSSDTGAINALDHAAGSGVAAVDQPVDTTPLPGVAIDKLNADKQKVFYKLVGSLSSPCGKAHSLRTSFTSDTTCKRAPFAVRYVLALVDDEATETQINEMFDKKYKATGEPVKIDVSKAPHEGPEDAPIKLVEFFDYGCPHCAAFKPMLEQVMKDDAGKVAEYFMMFPLEKHEFSKSAAQAALAANAQGKFKEMHDMLFAKAPDHDHDHVTGYAKQLGLDLGKFEAAYNDAAPQVAADLAQGEKAGVDSTPTMYFNERKYEGPMHPKYIEMWIDEELAVNR